jgi:hypothetical protein
MTLFNHTKFASAEDVALTKLFEAFETSHKRHLIDGDDEDLIKMGPTSVPFVTRRDCVGLISFVTSYPLTLTMTYLTEP